MTDFPKLSEKEAAIMYLLMNGGDSYGLDLVDRSGGRLKRGTIYVTLDRMETKGFVESWKESAEEGEQGPPRRLYKVTGYGKQVFDLWQRLKEAKKSWLQTRNASAGMIRGGAK